MTEIFQVGLIGAGLMGHGIGKNILARGHGLTVLAHRNRQPIDSLVSLGASESATAAETARRSNVVILCVTGSPQVEDIMYRDGGLLEGIQEDTIIADCTTAEPESTAKVAQSVEEKGGQYVDIPLSRTPKEAEEGRLALMTGGDQEVLARIRPLLECFADTIVHAGPVGSGHKLKLLNNYLALTNAVVVAEGISAASQAGVDLKALHEVVTTGGANSVMFERLIKVALENDDSSLKFYIENARKDLRYYSSMTRALPHVSFMAEAALQLITLADNLGHGKSYVPQMVNVLSQVNKRD